MTTNQTIDGVPRRICHACVTFPRKAYCPVCDDEPSAKPQGEPVAWLAQAIGKDGEVYRNTASPSEITLRDVGFAWGQGVIDRFKIVIKPLYAEQPAPVANTWPKLSFMAIAAGEHAHADYCQKHAYGSLNEYRNHEALTHAIEVAVAYDKLNSKPAPVAVLMPTQEDFERFIIRRDGSVNVSVLGNSRFYNDATIDSEYFVWLTCLDEVTQLNAKSR